MSSIAEICASRFGVQVPTVLALAKAAPFRIRKLEIPKAGGGVRRIWRPAVETRAIQYVLIAHIFENMKLSQYSTAFSKGNSIRKNAALHAGNEFVLRVDLKDFFPSISWQDLESVFSESWPAVAGLDAFSLADQETKDFIKWSCFNRSEKLPIGYPSSPFIANVVMTKFDEKLVEQLSASSVESFVYSRYADDLVFSTNKKGWSHKAYLEIMDFVEKWRRPRLSINHEKTHFGSRAKGTSYVTGVHCLPGGRLAVRREIIDESRLLLSLSKRKDLSLKDLKRLFGLLEHIRHIDGRAYAKLKTSYFLQIASAKTLLYSATAK
jgi:RNA-directed DNA polymerase